jgi:hypothetical protein
MTRLHAEPEGAAPAAPPAARERPGDVGGCERDRRARAGYPATGAQAADGAARTRAAERYATAAGHVVSRAPDPSGPKGSQMTITHAGQTALPCRELAAARRAAVTAAGDHGNAGAPRSRSRRC